MVDGGSAYLRTGGHDLHMVEVLVDPQWPANVSLDLLRRAHQLAVDLRCGFDPSANATADDVNRAISWMESALALARRIDPSVRGWLIDAGGGNPGPSAVNDTPAPDEFTLSRMTKGVAMRYGDIEERSLSERLTEILGDAAQAARVLAEIRRPSRRMIDAGLREEDRHVLGWKPETCHGSADLCLAMVVDAMIKAELDEMRHEMTFDVEGIVDGGMKAEKALR